jgi:hypothetical protein
MKTFRFKVPALFSSVNAADISQWLEQTLASGAPLSPDCGPGDAWLGVELDESAVARLVEREGESPTQVLRRLLVTRVPSSPVQQSPLPEPEPGRGEVADVLEPPKPVLPKRMQLDGSDVLPLAKILTFASSRLTDFLWKVTPAERDYLDAEMSRDSKILESEAKLADAVAGILNNRAPRLLVENADVVKGSLVFAAHEGQIFNRRSSRLQEKRHEHSARSASAAASVPAAVPVSGSAVSASVEAAVPVRPRDGNGVFVESEESQRQRMELLRRSVEEVSSVGLGEPL